jgi:hypothetical protein
VEEEFERVANELKQNPEVNVWLEKKT